MKTSWPLAAALFLISTPLFAQEWELGARYWLSDGDTKRSHSAQDLVPALGNPTSVLRFKGLRARIVELHARKAFANDFYLRGNIGLGSIRGGNFDDVDFLAGQVVDTETSSAVKGDKLRYFSIDVGHDLWTFNEGRGALGGFAGYHYWRERLDAFGARFIVPAGAAAIPENVAVVSNDTTWKSIRVGVAGRMRLGAKTRLLAEFAYVPRSDLKDEDSHYLRSDLGPPPNIRLEGRGKGVQFELELRHALLKDLELGAGYRYWRLRSTEGTREAAGLSLPLVEFKSERSGLMLSLTKRW
jgi:hypothetical protein